MGWAAYNLGLLELEVDQGIRTRDFHRNEIAKWSTFFTAVAQKTANGSSYDMHLPIVWKLLLKNGFASEAQTIATKESKRTDLDQQQRDAWSKRIELAAERIDAVSQQASEIKADPRFNL